jgi:hypothetical protein
MYRLVNADLSRLAEVEVTIGWHTEGEGMRDAGALDREIQRAGDGSLDAAGTGTFSVVLPASPLSYHGVLIKVCWAVQVRARFSRSQYLKSEEAFQLGHVASVVADSPA